jgi:lysophospholipase L1-like esterase
VRDDRDIGPKPAERRIVILGDSLVLSVQVDRRETLSQLLEDRLNRDGAARYRVINAGVQGYGPVEERLFFHEVARAFQPDLVIETLFVGNDAEEAVTSAPRLRGGARPLTEVLSESVVNRLRRIVRRSMVLQLIRLRILSVTGRLTNFVAPPEAPLRHAAKPAPRIVRAANLARVRGGDRHEAAARRHTIVLLMPARFQVDDADYGHLKKRWRSRWDARARRCDAALRPGARALPVPRFDVLPALKAALPGPAVFFQQTVHLTPRGHEIVAQALEAFIRKQGL